MSQKKKISKADFLSAIEVVRRIDGRLGDEPKFKADTDGRIIEIWVPVSRGDFEAACYPLEMLSCGHSFADVDEETIDEYTNAWASVVDHFEREDDRGVMWQAVDSLNDILRAVLFRGFVPGYFIGLYGSFVLFWDKCLNDFSSRCIRGLSRMDREEVRERDQNIFEDSLRDDMKDFAAASKGEETHRDVLNRQIREVKREWRSIVRSGNIPSLIGIMRSVKEKFEDRHGDKYNGMTDEECRNGSSFYHECRRACLMKRKRVRR